VPGPSSLNRYNLFSLATDYFFVFCANLKCWDWSRYRFNNQSRYRTESLYKSIFVLWRSHSV